ncbi:TrmH family RNA methyltransferase [Candidatus Cloacimonadota bacterium]
MNVLSRNQLKELAKFSQKKYRDLEQKVIVEGFRLIQQLLENGTEIEEIYTTDPENLKILPDIKCKIFQVEQWQLEKITSTKHPQNIAALVPLRKLPILRKKFLLYLDNVSEPGNLGTIFRTAAAAGIDGIVLSPECCEVYNPKVIRASLGSVFSIPFEIQAANWLKDQDSILISTGLKNSKNLFEIKVPDKDKILVLGSEAHGISQTILKISDFNVHIPMSDNIESLNVAVAAGIIIFHLQNAR